ncbi:MAG: DUF815 domain-containing protein [Eubacteriales bacterium]
MKIDLNEYLYGLSSLSAYYALGETPLMKALMDFLQTVSWENGGKGGENHPRMGKILSSYGRIFHILREGGFTGFGDYFWDYCRYSPTLYGKLITEFRWDPALENAARNEIDILVSFAQVDCDDVLEWLKDTLPLKYQDVVDGLPRWSSRCPFDFDSLTMWHKSNGYGIFAKHSFFVWRNGKIYSLPEVETRSYEKLRGYNLQREQVLENTARLMGGEGAQNILLFGDGGTGKSAVVKSMPSVFEQLKLIQIEHSSLDTLPQLIGQLGKRTEKFVIFIDDLTFEENDNSYSSLKSVLEGGLETPPNNVLVYVTSNRRHLVRHTFSERAGEEVDMTETIIEKTALAQRFGLRIPYLSMSKEEYLALVAYLLEDKEVEEICPEELQQKAMMWEIRHGGRTPRVAEQFVSSLK